LFQSTSTVQSDFSLSVETPKIVKFPTGISFPLAGDNIFTPTDWGTFFVEVIEFVATPVVESSPFTLVIDCGEDPSYCGRILLLIGIKP
jgi:hypothetical protein